MNIKSLTVKMMLNTTGRWLGREAFRQQLLAAGSLGQGMLDELEGAHASLAELSSRRNAARERMRELIDLCVRLDQLHDRKARALYRLFEGLIEGSDDAKQITRYRQLQGLLFPDGLRVVRLPYIEEGGAAFELERTVGPDVRKQLASIIVDGQNLLQVFDDWMSAAHQLGEAMRGRIELQASLTRKGSSASDIDVRRARGQWLRAVRGLLWAVESRPELEPLAEPIDATLAAGIETALRRRGELVEDGEDDGDGEDDEDLFEDTSGADDDDELDDDELDVEQLDAASEGDSEGVRTSD